MTHRFALQAIICIKILLKASSVCMILACQTRADFKHLHQRCGIMHIGQRREHNGLTICNAESATRRSNAQTAHAVRYCPLFTK